MNRRGTGVVFCLMSVLQFIAIYVCSAIYLPHVEGWGGSMFKAILDYQGYGLLISAFVFLVIGAGYLIKAEIDDRKQ